MIQSVQTNHLTPKECDNRFILPTSPDIGFIYDKSFIYSALENNQNSSSLKSRLCATLNKFLHFFAPIFGMTEKRIGYTKIFVESSLKCALDQLWAQGPDQKKSFINVRVGSKSLKFTCLPGIDSKENLVKRTTVFFEEALKNNPFARTYGLTVCCFKKTRNDMLEADFRIVKGKNWGMMLYSIELSYSAGDRINVKDLHLQTRRAEIIEFINKRTNLSLTQEDLFNENHQLVLS